MANFHRGKKAMGVLVKCFIYDVFCTRNMRALCFIVYTNLFTLRHLRLKLHNCTHSAVRVMNYFEVYMHYVHTAGKIRTWGGGGGGGLKITTLLPRYPGLVSLRLYSLALRHVSHRGQKVVQKPVVRNCEIVILLLFIIPVYLPVCGKRIHDFPWIHCPKSNQNFRNITWNVEKNEILPATFHISRKTDYLWESVAWKSA